VHGLLDHDVAGGLEDLTDHVALRIQATAAGVVLVDRDDGALAAEGAAVEGGTEARRIDGMGIQKAVLGIEDEGVVVGAGIEGPGNRIKAAGCGSRTRCADCKVRGI
jgi:hypothetical protein